MLRNYFKIAWRNIGRNKLLSIINITGLSIGLTVCMLIFLYAKDELSYDQFHQHKDQIFRIIQTWQMGDSPAQTIGITNAVMGQTFDREIPGIEHSVRISGGSATVKKQNNVFAENPLFVDDDFFSVFTFPLLEGSKQTALKDLHSVVLSQTMANKFFGTADAVGKTLQIKLNDKFESFTVTAVARDAPENSSLKFGMIMPFKYVENHINNQGWVGGSLNTFLELSPKANAKSVENKMQALFNKNAKDELAKAKQERGITIKIKLSLQPLTDIHLSTKAGAGYYGLTDGSKPAYSYILTCIALFILIIACINFINLSIAQSLKRSKEIGVRKVVGSDRKQLIGQFLGESILVTLIAFGIAIVLTVILLPFFNELANKRLSLSYLSDVYLVGGYFLLFLFTSFIAGFYPSLVLSAFKPVKALYGRQKLMGNRWLTKGLIILQFTLTISLIISTFAINSQFHFLLHTNLGYDSKDLVKIDLPFNGGSDKLATVFKNELANRNNIVSVAATSGMVMTAPVKVEGKQITIQYNKIDDRYLPTFRIPIVFGRNFSSDYLADSTHSVIVNQTFVRDAGWNIDNAIGKTINFNWGSIKQATVVGVVRDYHSSSLKYKIPPEVFSMNPGMSLGQIWVRIGPNNVPKTLSFLKNTYKKLVPNFPYSYHFMSEINAKNYETEAKWRQIITIASALFIFISCIGLLGLVILMIEHRTKEIGVRKILGASTVGITTMLSKDFLKLVGIGFLIAVPIGWYAMHKWLENFAYHIHIGVWIFVLAGVLAMLIALATVSWQSIRAAVANPVDSLRNE